MSGFMEPCAAIEPSSMARFRCSSARIPEHNGSNCCAGLIRRFLHRLQFRGPPIRVRWPTSDANNIHGTTVGRVPDRSFDS